MNTKKYWQMFVDVWRLFRTSIEMARPWDADFYHGLGEKADKLNKKYQSEFFRCLVVAAMDEIERIDKNARG